LVQQKVGFKNELVLITTPKYNEMRSLGQKMCGHTRGSVYISRGLGI